ncbi:UDP-phosphate galactose phosphotransferase [Enterococcus sp. CU12B]|uniref:UDP-phosphate galactose phosphotransferase n=1 Tax=Candidatus Enterococcus willemsii TaxID=1857215 RepID=A0ABQ6YZ42_9ENTE|nr:sugar transferase [Enterococcus sp. CU12B]KAF1303635.1 UDP-phosphate galactose phosphotransferase [Enterococcus sp. CU12B]
MLDLEKEDVYIEKKDIKSNFIDREKVEKKYVYRFIKRIIDVLGSSIGLIVLSPIFLVVAILMKKEEPNGPIFFSQTRVGKNESKFKMFKFRSMCVDAEEKLAELLKHNEVEGAMFKMKDDPRITKVGKFIRKTSIDELPQLWNVLKGDMSLVGPRPPLLREVAEYTEYDKQRLLVKPGCTGLWQVSGRNEVGFDEMVELDIEYIQNGSIWNDVKIMFKTILVMIKPNGAY